MTEFEKNEQVAGEICRTQAWKGRRFELGDFVGLLDGNVVAVDTDALVVLRKVRAINSDPTRGMMFEVGPPVVDVIRRP